MLRERLCGNVEYFGNNYIYSSKQAPRYSLCDSSDKAETAIVMSQVNLDNSMLRGWALFAVRRWSKYVDIGESVAVLYCSFVLRVAIFCRPM